MKFFEVKFDEPIESWLTELEEILSRTLDSKERVRISQEIFADIHQKGYTAGLTAGLQRNKK